MSFAQDMTKVLVIVLSIVVKVLIAIPISSKLTSENKYKEQYNENKANTCYSVMESTPQTEHARDVEAKMSDVRKMIRVRSPCNVTTLYIILFH